MLKFHLTLKFHSSKPETQLAPSFQTGSEIKCSNAFPDADQSHLTAASKSLMSIKMPTYLRQFPSLGNKVLAI